MKCQQSAKGLTLAYALCGSVAGSLLDLDFLLNLSALESLESSSEQLLFEVWLWGSGLASSSVFLKEAGFGFFLDFTFLLFSVPYLKITVHEDKHVSWILHEKEMRKESNNTSKCEKELNLVVFYLKWAPEPFFWFLHASGIILFCIVILQIHVSKILSPWVKTQLLEGKTNGHVAQIVGAVGSICCGKDIFGSMSTGPTPL